MGILVITLIMVYTNVFSRTYRFRRSITVNFKFEMFSTEGSLVTSINDYINTKLCVRLFGFP